MVFCCYGIISAEQALIILSKIHKLLFFCKFFSFFFYEGKKLFQAPEFLFVYFFCFFNEN